MVAPYAGAWIEIELFCGKNCGYQSLPTRERGLKLSPLAWQKIKPSVAPYAGAWIEIHCIFNGGGRIGRSLRGSVD